MHCHGVLIHVLTQTVAPILFYFILLLSSSLARLSIPPMLFSPASHDRSTEFRPVLVSCFSLDFFAFLVFLSPQIPRLPDTRDLRFAARMQPRLFFPCLLLLPSLTYLQISRDTRCAGLSLPSWGRGGDIEWGKESIKKFSGKVSRTLAP